MPIKTFSTITVEKWWSWATCHSRFTYSLQIKRINTDDFLIQTNKYMFLWVWHLPSLKNSIFLYLSFYFSISIAHEHVFVYWLITDRKYIDFYPENNKLMRPISLTVIYAKALGLQQILRIIRLFCAGCVFLLYS